MKTLIFSLIILSFCYFIMKYVKVYWNRYQLPHWSKYPLGFLAWGILISFSGILWELAQPIIDLFTAPTMGVVMQLCGYAFAITILATFINANPEVFDFASMKPFLKNSLIFADPACRMMIFADELDKHNVQRVYKETTGKDLPKNNELHDQELQKNLAAIKGEESFSMDKRVSSSKDVLAILQKPIESPHTKEDLRILQEVSKVDISDTWFLNCQKKSSHQYFHLTKKVTVDPATGRIDFVLESKHFTDEKVRERESLYRLKQNLYEFVQAVNQQDWMQSYLHFVSMISCTCCRVEDEVFGSPQVHQICRVELSRDQLKTNENKFYDAWQIKVEVLV